MPIPIVCLEASLRQYTEEFCALFSRPQFQHFVTVLLGLITAPERRTLLGFQRCVAGARSLSALSRFLAVAPWEERRARQGMDGPLPATASAPDTGGA